MLRKQSWYKWALRAQTPARSAEPLQARFSTGDVSAQLGRRIDPRKLHHGAVIRAWAEAVWEGSFPTHVLDTILHSAFADLRRHKWSWRCAYGPAHAVLLVARDLHWRPMASRSLQDRQGRTWDMLKMSPALMCTMAQQATQCIVPASWPARTTLGPRGRAPNTR